MKILYICTNFLQKSNSAAIRNLGLISGLVDNGEDVTVLTIKMTKDRSTNLHENLNIKLKEYELSIEKVMANTASIRKKQDSSKSLRRLRHLVRSLLFFPDLYKEIINKVEPKDFAGYDIVISSSDMKSSHFLARKIVKYHKYKWFQIWGDPWYADIGIEPILRPIIKKAEKKLIKEADRIFYVSEPTLNFSKVMFPKYKDKLDYIPRSYLKKIYNKSDRKKKLRILYPGSLGPNRNIVPLVNWFLNNKINFQLDIYGSIRENDRRTIVDFRDVKIHEPVDYDRVLELFSETDVLLFLSNSKDSTQIPGKIFDYFGTNIPVLCVMHTRDEPVSQFLMTHENCFIITYDEIESNVLPVENFQLFIEGKYLPVEKYGPNIVAKKLIEKISDLI